MNTRPITLLAGVLFLMATPYLLAVEVRTEPSLEDVRKDEPVTWYRAATKAATYEAATAHDPRFADKALWNDDARRSDYAKQTWPKSRVLTWANPAAGAKDGWEAKYWLEDGKPAAQPFDENTDLVMPKAAGWYWVSLTDGRKYQPARFRHLTINNNACVSGHLATHGNVWIKQGGVINNMDTSLGEKHTFYRWDNIKDNHNRRGVDMVDHFFVRKAASASVEFIGLFRSTDNWQIQSGMMIVAPDSEVGLGNRTSPVISKDAAVAILSGGYLSRRTNCDWGNDLTVEGTLYAGLPGRPLTSDARLGLGWKSKGSILGSAGGGRSPGPNDVGMFVAQGGSITVTTSDPATARLVINCSKRDNDWGQISIISRGHPLHGKDGEPIIAKMKEMPRLTDMVIAGTMTWSAIRLDDILAGGITLTALPELSGANSPTFGTGSAAKPEALFTIKK